MRSTKYPTHDRYGRTRSGKGRTELPHAYVPRRLGRSLPVVFQDYHDGCGDGHSDEGNRNRLRRGLEKFLPRDGGV